MTETAAVERALATLRMRAPTSLPARVIATWVRVAGPVGDVFVACTDHGIAKVTPAVAVDDDGERFAASYRDAFVRPIVPGDRVPPGVERALHTGDARGLDYDLRGLSEFEQAVLRKTLEIPRGEVRPYSWVAREIGRPGAVRATGSALGRNPVPVLIPCHRVIRADGMPGNYGFGPAMKEELLTAEDIDVDEMRTLAAHGMHFVGSDTTGIVCYPSCRHARRITPAHRREFATMRAATSDGYRPCLHCRPALAASA